MSQVEAGFWNFVARERAALKGAERPTVEDVVAWLEAEKARAKELRFSYSLRNEPLKAAYEEGRLEVINAVLLKLQKLEKRLRELERKARFMKRFEGGGEYYEGFLEALRRVGA